MLISERLVVVPAPLRRDCEERRWYGDGGDRCVVLTRRGRLLEPIPTFGPSSYRLLACRVSSPEARGYAASHELRHERTLPASAISRWS